MNSIALNLEPQQYLAGWRADSGSLFLPALSESRVGDQVVARIGLFGQPVRATVYGKVAMVRRIGRPSLPPGVDVHLEPASFPAARYLAAVAAGEPVKFTVRPPRYAVQRTVLVVLGGEKIETRTVTISEGGCSLAWPAGNPPPSPGELLALRLGNGFLTPVTEAVVAWTDGTSSEGSFGVRIVAEGRGGRAWRAVVEDAARSQARIT